jgi:hypothetical protein
MLCMSQPESFPDFDRVQGFDSFVSSNFPAPQNAEEISAFVIHMARDAEEDVRLASMVEELLMHNPQRLMQLFSDTIDRLRGRM